VFRVQGSGFRVRKLDQAKLIVDPPRKIPRSTGYGEYGVNGVRVLEGVTQAAKQWLRLGGDIRHRLCSWGRSSRLGVHRRLPRSLDVRKLDQAFAHQRCVHLR